jgi:hypothetical protein
MSQTWWSAELAFDYTKFSASLTYENYLISAWNRSLVEKLYEGIIP